MTPLFDAAASTSEKAVGMQSNAFRTQRACLCASIAEPLFPRRHSGDVRAGNWPCEITRMTISGAHFGNTHLLTRSSMPPASDCAVSAETQGRTAPPPHHAFRITRVWKPAFDRILRQEISFSAE